MLCKGCYQISMVSAFSYEQAKTIEIQYVNLVPRALLPGSKARGKSPGDGNHTLLYVVMRCYVAVREYLV